MLRRYLRSIYEMISSVTTKRAADQQHVKKVELDGPPAAKVQRKPKITTYAMLLAYEGRNYFGMQMQRQEQQFPTVEMHLLNAMLQHGFITEEHKSDLYPWHFQRAARTDRSVSAVRQICSMHLSLDPHFIEDGTSLLNSSLPADIRVFGIKRVTPSFHAQKSCDGRTYSYTMPTFSLAPVDQLTNDEYRLPEERIAETEKLLRCFLGTHNFFNYTSRLDFKDPRAKRTIQQIRCDRPFLYTDPVRNKSVEFVSIYITGQSFIMHQIRKMIGVVLAILRGFLYKSDITRSFQPDRMDIPRAPGLGLLLERLHYNRFENRHEKTHGSLNNWGEKLEKDIVSWRNRTILERILSEECHTQNMMRWLTTLPVHRYILDPEDEKGQNTSELRQASLTALSVLRAEGSSQAQLFEEADVEEDADPELALEEAEAPIEETSGSSSNGRRQQAEQKWAEEGEEEDDVEVETQEGLPTAESKKNVDEGEEEVPLPAKEAAAAV